MRAVPPVAAATTAPARPAPDIRLSRTQWLRANFFASAPSGLVTVVLLALCIWLGVRIFNWGVVHAVFAGSDPALCAALEGRGACWLVVKEKLRLMLFGLYPYDEQWRPAICLALVIGLLALSAFRRFWSRALAGAWLVALAASGCLMWGGVFGLPYVHEDRWGGLPVTLLLALFGLVFAFPIAVLVALARRATGLPGVKAMATVYVEFIRGVPMVTVLFMASVMFPLLLPTGTEVSKLLRVFVAFTLFAAAYLSEVIRGGLQSLPKGQIEAAESLGLNYWKTMGLVLLPQALRLTIPSIVNVFIGFFKATSVVTIVGVYDLLTAAKRSVADPLWQNYNTEVYLFIAAVFFVFCFGMSRFSQGLERRLKTSH